MLSLILFTIQAQAASCGKVTIADMNWNSPLNCQCRSLYSQTWIRPGRELIPGDTMPTGTSMTEKGDIAPELWSNSLKTALDKGVQESGFAMR